MEFVLCYVDNGLCYFTSKPLKEQWGDDWNDAPYEANAGTPYKDEYYEAVIDGVETGAYRPIPFKKVYVCPADYTCSFVEPDDGYFNCPYSVQDINGGACPWLKIYYYNSNHEQQCADIYAGITYDDFLNLIKDLPVEVYLKAE